MAQTTFSGPVASQNGFIGGTSTSPITVTTAQNISSAYGSTSAATGDTRLSYNKLTFTAAGGAGETIRAFSVVSHSGAAAGGTINGAHISTEVDGTGSISGAANALRATLGGTQTAQTGTLAVLQLDTNYTGSVTTPATSAFLRVSDSGGATGKINNLFNIETGPAATLLTTGTTATVAGGLKVRVNGTPYYIMLTSAVS